MDKNTGVVLVSNEICEKLAISHLNDVSIYETLDQNPIQNIFNEIVYKCVRNIKKRLKYF
jgi:hypothetical protein